MTGVHEIGGTPVILRDCDGLITIRIRDNTDAEQIQNLPGTDFLRDAAAPCAVQTLPPRSGLRPAPWQQPEAASGGATAAARRAAGNSPIHPFAARTAEV